MLKKEPDNAWDQDAIMVKFKGLQVGYVANNYHTKVRDTYSAGRLYDRIGKKAKAKVICVIPNGAICEITDFGFKRRRGKKIKSMKEYCWELEKNVKTEYLN